MHLVAVDPGAADLQPGADFLAKSLPGVSGMGAGFGIDGHVTAIASLWLGKKMIRRRVGLRLIQRASVMVPQVEPIQRVRQKHHGGIDRRKIDRPAQHGPCRGSETVSPALAPPAPRLRS